MEPDFDTMNYDEVKGYLVKNDNDYYIISEDGEKVWNNLPFDQKSI